MAVNKARRMARILISLVLSVTMLQGVVHSGLGTSSASAEPPASSQGTLFASTGDDYRTHIEQNVSSALNMGAFTEDVTERTAERKVLRNGDQTKIIIGMAPLHYPVGHGAWSDIDNRLVPTAGEFAFKNKGGPYGVRFTDNRSGNRIEFEYDGTGLTIEMVDSHGSGSRAGSLTWMVHAQDNVITYSPAGASFSVEYQVGSTGIHKNIYLQNAGAPSQFEFLLTPTGVIPELKDDGSIWFVYLNSVTERAFFIPPPFAEDQKGVIQRVRTTLTERGDGKWLLALTADSNWLLQPGRSWPVRIDPTIFADTGTGQWLQLNQDNEWWNSDTIRVENVWNGPYYTGHMQFDLTTLSRSTNSMLSSAYLTLSAEDSNCYICGAELTVAQEELEWFQTVSTWQSPGLNRQWSGGKACSLPGCTSTRIALATDNSTVVYSSNGRIYRVWRVNVTEMVRTWLNGSVRNNGFFLYDSTKAVLFLSPYTPWGGQYTSRLELNYTSVGAPSISVNASSPSVPVVSVTSTAPITKTELYVDGVLAGTNTSSASGSYTFPIDVTRFPYATHKLTARVYTDAGQHKDSSPVNALFGDGGVTPPVNLVVLPRSGGGTRLSWVPATASNPSRSITYTVIRSADNTFSQPITVAEGLTGTFFEDTTATGAPFYRVRAISSAGVSSPLSLAAQSLTPTSPFELRHQHMVSGAVRLRWASSPSTLVDSGVTYRVYRNNTLIASGLTSPSYTDSSVVSGTTYSYYVLARNAAGMTSSPSETIVVTAQGSYAGPEAPQGLRALTERNNHISLTWTASSDPLVRYEVYRYTGTDPWLNPGSAQPSVSGLAAGSWTDSSPVLSAGQVYWYRVRAVKNGVSGPWSEPAGAMASLTRRAGLDQRQAFVEIPAGQTQAAVNLSSGNLVLGVRDAFIPVPYLSQSVERIYNSQTPGVPTTLGNGWRLNAEWRVEVSGETVFVVEGDGTEHRFGWDGAAYLAEERYYGVLTRDSATDRWTLMFPDLTRLSFGADGRLERLQERSGNELAFEYDTDRRLISIRSHPTTIGRAVLLEYDAGGQLVKITDSANRETSYEYDGIGRLSRVIDHVGGSTWYDYDTLGRLVRTVDQVGRWTYFAYGTHGGVSTIVDGLGGTITVSPPILGTALVKDATGNVNRYSLDGRGWLTSTTDALNQTTSFAHTVTGTTFSAYTLTNPRGLITSYSVDSQGRVTGVTESPAVWAETQDLVAPGITSRASSALYNSRGDRVDEASQITGSLYRGTSAEYTYVDSGTFPDALSRVVMSSYTQSSGGTKKTVGGTHTYVFDTVASRPGWLVQSIDPNGNVTDYTYHDTGLLKSETRRDIDADLVMSGAVPSTRDLVRTYAYNQAGQIISMVNWHLTGAVGNATTTYQYDGAGRLTQVTYPDGARHYLFYDLSGMKIMEVGAEGGQVTHLHDPAYRIGATVLPDGYSNAFAYDAAGRVTAITGPMNSTTAYSYDPVGRVMQATDPNGMATRLSHDAVGNVISETRGSATLLAQNPTKGITTRYEYYLSGLTRRTKELVPTSAILQLDGSAIPPLEPGDPSGTTYNITTYHYNRVGDVIDKWDGNNSKATGSNYRTHLDYDDLGRLNAVTQYLNGSPVVTAYGYDNNGNRTSTTDPGNRTTSYRYDALNRLWRERDGSLTVAAEYRYDNSGNLSQKIEPRQIGDNVFQGTTNYTYDNRGRLLTITYTRSDGSTLYKTPVIRYAYDGLGRRVYRWDGYGPMFYSYDVRGRLSEERSPLQSVQYFYDAASNLTKMSSHLGDVQYAYDAGNRIREVRDPLNHTGEYTYDSNYGFVTALRLPTSQWTSVTQLREYHALSDGRWTDLLKRRWGTWSGTYLYDLSGMVTRETASDRTATFHYDHLHRLVQADGTSGNNSYPNNHYSYDASGNRTSWGNHSTGGAIYQIDSSGTWRMSLIHDAANRLSRQTRTGPETVEESFQYEGNGNLRLETHTYTQASQCYYQTSRVHTLNYYHDDAGRLVRVRKNDDGYVSAVNFQYDGDGRRVRQTPEGGQSCSGGSLIPGVSVSYQYANGEVLNERRRGGVPVWYIRSPNGDLLWALHEKDRAYVPAAYIRDHLGSVRELRSLDATNSYTYDPYGSITKSNVTLRNDYHFTSYSLNQAMGVYYAKARYYQPSWGRFLTQDTWKGTPWQPWTQNLYVYVGNNPVNYVDPTGHWAETAFDVISLGFSLDEFRRNPGLANGLWVAVDIVAIAVPVMPGTGLIRKASTTALDLGTGAYKAGATGGTGLGKVAGKELTVTEKGLSMVEGHLDQFGPYGPNEAMVGRLRLALEDGRAITGADASFYLHELNEATLMGKGLDYGTAHQASLRKYDVSPYSVYHPDVIRAFPDEFNSNWRNFWSPH